MRYCRIRVLVLITLFAGCASGGAASPDSSRPFGAQNTSPTPDSGVAPTTEIVPSRCVTPTEPFTVKVWQILPDQNAGALFNTLVSEFNATHADIKIESEKVKGQPLLIKRLQDDPKDTWPDIIVSSASGLKRLADSAMSIAPGECPSGSEFDASLLPSIAAAYSVGGQVQAAPYGVSTPVLLFDANEMRAAGLDPDHPPKTADELFAASKQIVDRGVSAYGLVVYDWYANFFVHQWAAQRGDLVATPNNGRNDEDITVDYDTADNRAALQWIVDVVAKGGGAWIGGEQSGLEDLVRIIQPSNGAVMSIHTSGSVGDILTLLDKGDLGGIALGVSPMPGPNVGGLVGGNGMWLIDHGSPQRAGAAWEAIRWFSEPKQMARFDVATGYIPPSEAVAATTEMTTAWAAHPQLKVGYDQLHAMAGAAGAAGPLYGPSSEIDAVFWDLTNSILDRHTDPGDALKAATKSANELIAAYQKETKRK